MSICNLSVCLAKIPFCESPIAEIPIADFRGLKLFAKVHDNPRQ